MLTSPHNLLQWEQPVHFLQRVLRIYPHEVKLLLWVTLIQLAMRVSSILINNFAQTAFLKRYGVEHLPAIFLIEAVLTFFFASAVGLLMERYRTLRVFTGLLFFFSLSVGIVRVLLPHDIALLYPILFILKSQAIEILPILYWDILTDLFTTQQSKRLYTLITAGGVLGTTLGSFVTAPVAKWVGVDNVLLIFVAGTVLAAFLNEMTEKVVGSPVQARSDRRRSQLRRRFRENFQEFIAFTKQSPLLKYMILIIAIPNMVLPILTYQFNVVVDSHFTTEQATLNFFGIFRGLSNALMFGLLLFTGRLVTKWGVATSLLFHPINYLIAFLGLIFRFDLIWATYARFSTETLKTTLNNPARAVLFNFFPSHMRGLVRVFLRGNVVRAADFAGSGLLLLIKGLVDPRLLSVVAAPFVLIWVYTSMKIKKRYPAMILQTLTDKQIDWERLEEVDFKAWANDKKTLERLILGLRDMNTDIAVACGEILAKIEPPGWTRSILEALPGKPAESQKRLLDLLKPEHAGQTVETLLHMAKEVSTVTLTHLITTLSRLDPKASLPVMIEVVDHPDPRVRTEALVGLYLSEDPKALTVFHQRIHDLLLKDEAGVLVAAEVLGRTGDASFSEVLLDWAGSKDTELKAWALLGLSKMRYEKAVDIALKAIEEPAPQVREAAVQVMMAFEGKMPLDLWIRLLGDEDPKIREKASLAIREQGNGIVQSLLPALALPSRVLRNEILSILDDMGPPPAELSKFVFRELEKAYRNLAYVGGLKGRENGNAITLLKEHLSEKNEDILEVVLRVLGILELGDWMKVILKAIQSRDRGDMDNAIEVLETSLHSDIRKILIPLLDERPLEEKLTVGNNKAGVNLPVGETPEKVLLRLLEHDDPFTQALALYALGEAPASGDLKNAISGYLAVENEIVKEAAHWALKEPNVGTSYEQASQVNPNLVEKVQSIRSIPIFGNFRVQEFIAIASKTLTKRLAKGEIAVREGDPGDALYLVFHGELAVIKAMGTGQEVTLGRIGKDDFFGEMALIDSEPRSATVIAESDTVLFVFGAEDFIKLIKEYPIMPVNISNMFAKRIRLLQKRLLGSKGFEGSESMI
jgi:HEAT repeat protein